MFKCLVFDIGGTLYKRSKKVDLAGKKAQLALLKRNGVTVSLSTLRKVVEVSLPFFHNQRRSPKPLTYSKRILCLLGVPFPSDALARAFTAAYYSARLRVGLKHSLAPGALSLLRKASSEGIILGVITDNDSSWCREWIQLLELPIAEDLILVSHEVGARKSSIKPFKVFFKKVKKKLPKIQPHEILMVGNHARDLNAQKAGFKTCYYNAQNKPLKVTDIKPDFTISHFRELEKVVLD